MELELLVQIFESLADLEYRKMEENSALTFYSLAYKILESKFLTIQTPSHQLMETKGKSAMFLFIVVQISTFKEIIQLPVL